jgi:hypothetical protein
LGSYPGARMRRIAVATLGGADIGPGLSDAVARSRDLREVVTGDGAVLLEQVEAGRRVAAYQVTDLSGNGDWVVSSYEYSGPCTLAEANS